MAWQLVGNIAGKSVTVEQMQPVIGDLVTKAVGAVSVPKDGAGVVEALLDRAGHLILTLSDGRTKDVGQVVGADGRAGQDVDPQTVETRLGELAAGILETWPRPRDGTNGKDGIDGLGFDDLEGAFDKGGRLVLRFKRGDQVVEVRVPCLTDQTVWRAGEPYLKGDGVTHDRSFWIAQVDKPDGRPGASKAWRLAVARGRDGKDRVIETPEAD